MNLEQKDPEIYNAVINELHRQQDKLELIASENFVSQNVLWALGSVLTNKYAEGYPQKRYYGGCECVDLAENLAIDRAKKLFGAEYVNVQPHSGSQANMAAYFSILSYGDTILSMNLAHGGHLTHGSPVNFSGKFFKIIPYGVDKDSEMINYEEVLRLAKENRPKLIIVGFSSYSRRVDFAKFREIADEVGAYLLADVAHPAGLIAADIYPDPIPHCHIVTTTTHKTLRGPRGGMIMAKADFEKKLASSLFPGIQGGPLMHVIAAKAVAFGEALLPEYKTYAEQIIKNAKALSSELINLGYNIVTGGTDSHLFLVNLANKNLTGKDSEKALDIAGITVNKNMVPFDTKSPFVTSGIRIGTPALTTRGMKEEEMKIIAKLINRVLRDIENNEVQNQVREDVLELTKKFPLYSS